MTALKSSERHFYVAFDTEQICGPPMSLGGHQSRFAQRGRVVGPSREVNRIRRQFDRFDRTLSYQSDRARQQSGIEFMFTRSLDFQIDTWIVTTGIYKSSF
ncbi:MAG: hypothetical protein H0V16_06325 [Burkholderiaceae bacterium]|nr:hypothetical protein [Burkholderiaceae bacterium]